MLGAILDNLFAQNRQNDAQAFSAQQYATRYQTQTEDMKKAGINPMLSVSSGAGSQPTSTAASPGSNFTQAALNSAQIANLQADTENKDAQGKLYEAQANAQNASANQSTANIAQIEANVQKIKEEIKNIPLEGPRIKALTNMLADQGNYYGEQGYTQQQVRKQLEQTIIKLKLDNVITQKDIDAMNKTGNLGRLARELQPASDIAGDWLNPAKWFTNKSKSTSTSTVTKGKP